MLPNSARATSSNAMPALSVTPVISHQISNISKALLFGWNHYQSQQTQTRAHSDTQPSSWRKRARHLTWGKGHTTRQRDRGASDGGRQDSTMDASRRCWWTHGWSMAFWERWEEWTSCRDLSLPVPPARWRAASSVISHDEVHTS